MSTSTCICVALLIAIVAARPEVEPVKVNYYAESLCPDCIALSRGAMNLAVKEVGDIFSLTYVPWGNAHLLSDGTFQCQHGQMECLINTVEACVLHYYPNRDDFWPFIHCMDEHGESQDLRVAEDCANTYNMIWKNIDTCTNGALGHNLELMYYNMTASLVPPHRYTPWVTVNGKHDTRAEGMELISVICETYTGTKKPEACGS